MAILKQNTDDWLDARKSKIGASDVPAILGIHPHKTAYQVYMEKTANMVQEDNCAMRKGREIEPLALQAFCERLGIIASDRVYFHPKHDWLMASCDGVDFDEKFCIEIKFRGREVHEGVADGRIPEYDYAQVQTQLECTGFEYAYYVSWLDGQINYTLIRRESAYFESILPRLLDFYSLLTNRTPPEMGEKDYELVETEERQFLHARMLELQETIEEAEAELEILKSRVRQQTPGRNSMGCGIKVWHSVQPGRVQYKEIPELKGVDIERYRKPSYVTWTVKAYPIQT